MAELAAERWPYELDRRTGRSAPINRIHELNGRPHDPSRRSPGHADEDEHEHHEGPSGLLKWLTSTDHKLIGMNYMVTSLVMFFLAGLMALVIRTQLASPEQLASSASSSTTSCSPCTAA